MAYTNHALDHLLSSVLDANITEKLVRLGSRSSDERIAEYTLDKLEKVAAKSSLDRSIGRQYGVMKRLEEQMNRVMEDIQAPKLTWSTAKEHLAIHYPDLEESMSLPSYWVQRLMDKHWDDEEENGEWNVEKRGKGKAPAKDPLAHTAYGFWKEGIDIAYISAPFVAGNPPDVAKQVAAFFAELGFYQLPPIPVSNRPLNALRDATSVWSMSLQERQRLSSAWEEEIQAAAYTSNLDQYRMLRTDYEEACQEYNDIKDEVRY